MKKKFNIALMALSIILMMTSNIAAASFSDINGHWAEEVIIWAADNGFISGYEDGTFKPQGYITRAEYYAITNQSTPEELQTNKASADNNKALEKQNKNKWYYNHLERGMKRGFVSLDNKGNILNPDEYITREEAFRVTAINEGWKKNPEALNKFTDKNQVKDEYKDYVGAAVAQKMIEGYPDKTLKPKNKLTRAEVVSLICKMKGYKPSDKKSDMSWTWGYTNSSNNFSKSYHLNDKEIKLAKKLFGPVDFRSIVDTQYIEPWMGSCQGFAVTSALFDYGEISANGVNIPEVKDLISAKAQDNYYSQSLINLHMLAQNTNVFKDFENVIDSYGSVNGRNGKYNSLKEYANALKSDLDKSRNGGSKVVVGVFYDQGGHAMTAYDYTMSGDNMFIKLYDSNRLCEGINIDLKNNKIIGKKLAINSNSQPTDTEIFYMDSFPIEDYIKLFGNKTMKKIARIVTDNKNKLSVIVDGKTYVLDDNYKAGKIIKSRNGNTTTYEIPYSETVKLISKKGISNTFLNLNGSRYSISYNRPVEVTMGKNKITSDNIKGNSTLKITTDEVSEHFKFDTVEIKSDSNGKISLEKTDRGYKVLGDSLKNTTVTTYIYGQSTTKSIKPKDGSFFIENVNNELVLDDNFIDSKNSGIDGTYYGYYDVSNDKNYRGYKDLYSIYYLKSLGNNRFEFTGRFVINNSNQCVFKTIATYDPSTKIIYIPKINAPVSYSGIFKSDWQLESRQYTFDGYTLGVGDYKLERDN